MKVRIKFKKYGPLRFIGHLDVMRFFQKAIRRAGIDVTYTMGFSPHQVMSFAAPLGVGLFSNGEYMDIQVNSLPAPRDGMTSCQVLVEQLNNASVKGLDVISARILPEDAGNAMASVAAASYTVRFREGREPALLKRSMSDNHLEPTISGRNGEGADNVINTVLAAFLEKENILITKETKRGSREVDLRPGIFELTWEGQAFHMLVDASSAGNIKPAQVIEALFRENGEALPENALLITREDVFTLAKEHGEGTHKFLSLGKIGSERISSERTSGEQVGSERIIGEQAGSERISVKQIGGDRVGNPDAESSILEKEMTS